MILPHPKDALHKAWLYRLLAAIFDHAELARILYFKGGTCAAMLGWLDRFSVDLDFDYVVSPVRTSSNGVKAQDMSQVRKLLEKVFDELGLTVKDKSKVVPQYFLKYPAKPNERNTIQIDVTFPPSSSNVYQKFRLIDIDRIITCQTKETSFANKLVTLIERYEKTGGIAGRDLYDIHHFFLQGFRYHEPVIAERRKTNPRAFLRELISFIEARITDTVITQDLGALLPPTQFQRIRKVLKTETLMFLRDEVERLENNTEGEH